MIPRKLLQCEHVTGSRVNGKFVPSIPTVFQIYASVHVVSGATLMNMNFITTEDGRVYKLITDNVLVTLKDGPNADIVIIDGRACRTLQAMEWKNNVINHNVYIVQEIIEK